MRLEKICSIKYNFEKLTALLNQHKAIKKLVFNILMIISLFGYTQSFAAENLAPHSSIKQKIGPIQTLVLQGSYTQMGIQYGQSLQNELIKVLSILKDFYIIKNGIPYEKIKNQANLLYDRYPYEYQQFIQGVAKGSGLSIDDAKILNAMETLSALMPNQAQKCAFISIPSNKTNTQATFIGRNYDYPPPFDQLSKYLTVTVIDDGNTIPTAFIAIAGEIYCPTCINAKGIFMELNNGMPSGGYDIDTNRQSLLINMLQILQNSTDLDQAEKQLNATNADYSLIINLGDKTHTKSFEFSSTLGMKYFFPSQNETFVSTNFYLNPTWENIPTPTDEATWYGVTRRNNLLNLANQSDLFDIQLFQRLMDKNIKQGGAVWDLTIYQLIYDTQDASLYVKINSLGNEWTKIPLDQLMSRYYLNKAHTNH